MDKKIADLVRKYPNDAKLGEKVRELYWKEIRKGLGLKDEQEVG